MANISSQIFMAVVAFIFPMVGLLFNILLSRKQSSTLNRCTEICKKEFNDKINGVIKNINNHFKNEINRILEIHIRKISSYKQIGRGDLSIGDNDIQSLDIKDLELDLTIPFKKIQRINKFLRKLESATARILIFRWVFGVILAIVLVVGFFLIVWPNLIPAFISITTLIISILSFIIFIFDAIKAHDLIDRTEREYGISIGE